MRREVKPNTKEPEVTILLAGNPNVGKSTIFNALTGLHQHTGNWPGKTVETAQGWFSYGGKRFRLVDLPGSYSLSADSPEEEITRDALSFGKADRVLLVADAVGLERNLYLVLQTLSITDQAVVCVNLMDEAARRGVHIDLPLLERSLGVPVLGVSARKKRSLGPLLETLYSGRKEHEESVPLYPDAILAGLQPLCEWLQERFPVSRRRALWMAWLLFGEEKSRLSQLYRWCGEDLSRVDELQELVSVCRARLAERGMSDNREMEKGIAAYRLELAKELAQKAVSYTMDKRTRREQTLDRIVTGRVFGYPLMLLLLAGVFALTIRGAELPSRLLGQGLFWLGDRLSAVLLRLGCPAVLHDALICGAYRMLAWVVSVMLPPMLVFFPLFTFLEDVGYLPRVAFQLDHCFHRCGSCGKQALTMAMGLGCNAVGVTGCRIISSPKDRTLAILTNSFIPCNGRFPMMILLIGFFLAPRSGSAALALCACVLLAVFLTLAVTKLLSVTVLKGSDSSFVLELPPYRPPQLVPIILRSILDRAVFVLGRAAAVAAPAGLLLWGLASIRSGDASLLTRAASYLEPLGRCMGMDGVILLAFILGSPANETVIPIAMMIYLSASSLSGELPSEQIREILLSNGWTWRTAASVILFTMLHWPCTTTLLTVRKETGSAGWTMLAAALPTVCGILACTLLHGLLRLLA